MRKAVRIIKYVLFVLLMLAVTACAPSKKSSSSSRKKQGSHVSASTLGRNKYYFSSGYQKKLSKGYKSKR